jgi:hypothetical protein
VLSLCDLQLQTGIPEKFNLFLFILIAIFFSFYLTFPHIAHRFNQLKNYFMGTLDDVLLFSIE